MSNTEITLNLVVFNGEKYIRHCLESIKNQTHPHNKVQVNILDNDSDDKTIEIIEDWKLEVEKYGFESFNFIKNQQNFGMWPGHEELLKNSSGKYVVVLSVDVILHEDFLSEAISVFEKDDKIGAIQPKVYKYDLSGSEPNAYTLSNIIDTCGFKVFKSRRIINIGHGEDDVGPSFAKVSAGKQFDFNKEQEIFAVEGAVPVFKKTALENCKIMNEIVDHDLFWYAEDLDVAWRLKMFGWKQVFAPKVIAWHDRQTTKKLKKNLVDFITIRKQIPLRKRRLEWRNVRFTIIKNDYTINILKDLFYILKRESVMFVYLLVFEPAVFLEIPNFLRLLPKMLRKRKEIMKNAVTTPKEIRKWFI